LTTASTVTVIDQSTDAAFRTWVAEFIAQCLAVGLTQTSDTGQINTSTVTRAAINSDAGYAIFRLNDTQQSGAPVFIKFYFGSASVQTTPRLRHQVGTASNGSGTISGTGSVNTDTISTASAFGSSITTRTSYWCYVDGVFWFAWKISAGPSAGAAAAAAVYARSVDNSGVASGDALAVSTQSGSSTWNARSLSFLTATVYGTPQDSSGWLLIHYGVTSSSVGGTFQVFKSYMITPRGRPQLQLVAVINAEIGAGIQFTATAVGSTSRNYINATIIQAGGYGAGLIWE
jgi:hypothetical protein